jgi:hypothetical protein
MLDVWSALASFQLAFDLQSDKSSLDQGRNFVLNITLFVERAVKIFICIKLGYRTEVGLRASGLYIIVQLRLTVYKIIIFLVEVSWVRDCVVDGSWVATLVAALGHQE